MAIGQKLAGSSGKLPLPKAATTIGREEPIRVMKREGGKGWLAREGLDGRW